MKKQPVHTVAGGAHLFRRDTAAKLGRIAGRYLDRYAADPGALCGKRSGHRLPSEIAEAMHGRVRVKLERAAGRELPDRLRRRFRRSIRSGRRRSGGDGGGGGRCGGRGRQSPALARHPHQVACPKSRADGRCAHSSFSSPRSRRTGRDLPDGFTVLLPKIVAAGQVERLVRSPEPARGNARPARAAGGHRPHGRDVAVAHRAGRADRPARAGCRGGGTVPHGASRERTTSRAPWGSRRRHQTLAHPLCDMARQVLQLSLAGTGVRLSDGATNVLPVEPHRGKTDDLAGRAGGESGPWCMTHGACTTPMFGGL